MNRSLAVALAVVTLDAMGLGIVMPVLPALLRELVPPHEVAGHYGILLSLYALMQVFFAPLLGRLSDRHGRRPVLLASLAGAAVDYAVMAAAPVLWVLYIGRIVAGITGATGAVAASTIADMTREGERARWFGFMGACFGGGVIAGPATGGLMGGISAHAPFMAAAFLNGVGFLLAFIFLTEPRPSRSDAEGPASINPLAAFRLDGPLRGLAALIGVFFTMQLIGQVPAALWVIYGEDRFHWETATVGLSLAAFGAVHALFQAFVTGPLSARLGERRTLLLGMMADGAGFLALAFATQGWMVLPILFLLAAGGVGMPALQAMLSRAAGDDAQGRLQGMLAGLTNLTSIIGPLGFTALYAQTAGAWNGWVWVAGAALYIACLPALLRPAAA
ncbi:Tet(A)/Tet(B)/Tet(C) family tetracycline efflux MFS transporter [Rhizobium sp. LCM 4573]|uniref:Tet(A)/Tet(B)/Tet(C) family tetracycline efflux MFS transporter n=1 Tax=Rhizobium sp. LCM 4573 TaxID=1848291 RepID=UPI0008DAB42F|nr:Tet(A)/Tet(B)/Tet(C) family tetracycline efflux MFS transporter [Rhizobium sp. LCM 4573]OHV75623.1 hypothetical protein LCM4573_15890 [Rhizobium sp. LCM 4573]